MEQKKLKSCSAFTSRSPCCLWSNRLKFKEISQYCYIRSIMLKYLFPLSFVYILTINRSKICGAWRFQRTFQIFPTTSVGLANSFWDQTDLFLSFNLTINRCEFSCSFWTDFPYKVLANSACEDGKSHRHDFPGWAWIQLYTIILLFE